MDILYVDEELIKGYVKDIKTYMIRELKKYITIGEEIDFSVELVNDINKVLQTIVDLKDSEYVTLKYNPMGAWYLESESDKNDR